MKENKTDMKNSETLEDMVQREGESENKMGIMPIKKLLFTMAWPAILSMTISTVLSLILFIVSWYFLSKYVEKNDIQ